MSRMTLWTELALSAGAKHKLGGNVAMGGPSAPGCEALCSGHDRPTGGDLDDQTEGLEHPPGPLDGGNRDAAQGIGKVVSAAAGLRRCRSDHEVRAGTGCLDGG